MKRKQYLRNMLPKAKKAAILPHDQACSLAQHKIRLAVSYVEVTPGLDFLRLWGNLKLLSLKSVFSSIQAGCLQVSVIVLVLHKEHES